MRRLCQEVNVIALDGELDQAEAKALFPRSQRVTDAAKQCGRAQGGQAATGLQRDVERMPAVLRRAARVCNAGTLALWRTAGSAARAAA
jgi:hypothetical protein